MILSTKRITKVLIRLRGCAGWSAPVLFANPRRQVFLRSGPYVLRLESLKKCSLHIVFHICLARFNSPWELATVWKEIKTLGDRVSLYPANYNVEKVRWALQTAKIISAEKMRHNTALKWILVLDGNQRVLFKPSLQ